MEQNDDLHNESSEEVDTFLYGVLDEQIALVQENQWLKYDESCMHVKYALLIKTIYDMILIEGWSPEMILRDSTHHIEEAKNILENGSNFNETSIQKEMTEEEFLEKLRKAQETYLD